MVKPSIGINQPQKALNRDQTNLGESDYSTLLNGLFDGIDGGTFTLTNEMSNLLSSKFKNGFKVINATNDIYSNNTYFFLVNPTNGIGEIGQIKNTQQVVSVEDVASDCDGCIDFLDLAEPLEGQTQVELNTYETLLTDECHILANTPEKGFQFNIKHPIKKTLIKNEKCGKTIYWTDNNQVPRYVVLDKLSQYNYTGDIVCGVDQRVATCLDALKLPIFRKYNLPNLSPTSIQLGGRLKLGVYEFLIAYCDQLGNEISEYVSITNPIRIFDRNNVTLLPSELATPTNFSIKLEVTNLDLRFSHYKIAVIQNTLDSVGATTYFIEGIHTINDNIVIYGGDDNKSSAITLSDLLRENLFVEKWEFITESQNSLIGAGITTEKEINLQPIVNLLPLKWQTHIATEELYKDGVASSKYLSVNRDEVVPYSIRFLLDGGYKTARFPLIGRNSKPSDLVTIPVENKDRESVNSLTSCVTTTRDKHWQYYNTATEDNDFCIGGDIDVVIVEEEVEKNCLIENVFTIPAGTYSIEVGEDFIDLKTYINDNKIDCIDTAGICPNTGDSNTFPFCNYLDLDCYTASNCTPTFNEQRVSEIVIGEGYIIYTVESGDNFTGTGYTASGIPFTATGQPTVWTNDTEVFKNSCATPIKINEEIIVSEVIGEIATKIEIDFPTEYSDTQITNTCGLYKFDPTSNPLTYLIDTRANPEFSPTLDTNYTSLMPCGKKAIVREYNFTNNSENSSQTLLDIPVGTTSNGILSYFNNYDLSTTLSDLLTTKTANAIATGWNNVIHKKALWFNTNPIDSDFIFEVTAQKLADVVSDNISDGSTVRLSFYLKKTSTTPFFTTLANLSTDTKLLFRKNPVGGAYSVEEEGGTITSIPTLFSNIFYVAADSKIVTSTTSTISNVGGTISCVNTATPAYRIATTDGCYSILTRSIEYSRIDVTFTGIVLDKQQTYTSICSFEKPVLNSCKATPYKKGTFAFWESEETYPDNESLYDSSTLKIKPADIPLASRVYFQDNFVIKSVGGSPILSNGYYTWKLDNLGKPLVNLTCRGIRHFKFPDNKVSPFMYESPQVSQSNSIIYPLGVTIDENTINAYLDIAVENNLITQEKRNLISGYEIFRGSIDQDRSIISSGLLFNTRTYEKEGQTWQYSNYPYNDLGKDKLNLDSLGITNNKFTYHSPETDYYRPTLPTELSVQGYVFGQTTNNRFEEVEEHPKYVILTNKAKDLASLLAGIEAASELAVNVAQSAETFRVGFGLANSVNIPGIILAGAVLVGELANIVVNFGRYRLEWLKAFRDLGQPQNFAYYNHSSAKYNYLQTLQLPEQQLRGLHLTKYLKSGDYIITDDVTGEKTNVNNLDREKTVFLTLGTSTLNYPTQYSNFDNNQVDNNTGSLGYASESGACVKGKSKDVLKNVASPYVAIKNYLPSQYGTINSISWLSTGYRGNLKSPNASCVPIFGGDTFISRHTVKRKISLFNIDNFGGGDLTPFAYKQYNNIGETPKFYIDYETGDTSGSSTIKGSLFPDIFYDMSLDCETKSGNYYRPPSKFYLYYYGVPNFLTETRINTWNRTAEPGLEKNFYPNTGDTGELTQEKNVPIKKEEYFFYNQIYSKAVTGISSRNLYDNFNQAESDCRNDKPNGIMWSLPDNSENNYNDPYLIYRDGFYEFDSKYGKLKDVRTIEREQILIRQENAVSLYNALDVSVDDGKNPETRNLASAFARRPMTYSETDLGFGGTQSSQSVSCEYGHFHVDAKRGQVIQIPTGGQGMEEISSLIGGKPSGMRNWFKEHLPFKILKSKIANLEDLDIDNAINGVGITMGYDSRFRRVFITKKDYIPKADPCLKFDANIGFYTDCGEDVNTCPEGYTYNESTQLCEITIINQPICPEGFVFNDFTGLCEQGNTCEEGLDIVIILDATGSQQTSIDNIKASVSTDIVPAIIANFGANYRLGLVSIKDRRISGQALFDILQPMSIANQSSFSTQINTIVATGGGGADEPSDLALASVLNNTTAIDKDGNSLGGNTIGTFRANAAKAIIFVTDNLPSGLNDDFDYSDWLSADALATQANSQGIQIFSYLTSPTQPTSVPPIPMVQFPNVTYVMQNYATVTGGIYYFTPSGVGISNGVISAVVDGITCPPPTETETICEGGCTKTEELCYCTQTIPPILEPEKISVSLTDPNYFQDVSWTIAFSPLEQKWVGWYSYSPNYYVSHQNYFQTGINQTADSTELGLWSHLLSNRSYQVFYGKKYPFIIEYMLKRSYGDLLLKSVGFDMNVQRYHNDYDVAEIDDKPFNRAYIYSPHTNSGELNLVVNTGVLSQISQYPKTSADKNSQEILVTKVGSEYTFNYFYNRMLSHKSNQPSILWDKNQINKTVNNEIVKFGGKSVLEPMRSNTFTVRLEQDLETRLRYSINLLASKINLEQ